jgi:hypothetical protein
MAVTVRRITLWRRDVDNRPGALAQVLEPLASTGTDLQVAMGFRIPGQESRAVLELAPVEGRAIGAAERAGLSRSDIPTLVVEGDNTPGLGLHQSRALAGAGINIAFLIAQVLGRRVSAVFGFETPADADRAAAVLKRVMPAVAARKRARPATGKKAAPKKAARKSTARKKAARRTGRRGR